MTFITKTRLFDVLFLALAGLSAALLYSKLMLLAVCVIFSYFLCSVMATAYVKMASRKLNAPLFEECDPRSFIESMRSLIAKHPKNYMLRIFLSGGLLALNANDEAYENLRLVPQKWAEGRKMRKSLYQRMLFGVHLQQDKLDEAKRLLDLEKESGPWERRTVIKS